jgi:hypothetical protein
MMTDPPDCKVASDTSTSLLPVVIHVKEPTGAEIFTPSGTLTEPYLDISQALYEGTWGAYTKIYLWSGTHIFDGTFTTWRVVNDQKKPLDYLYKTGAST